MSPASVQPTHDQVGVSPVSASVTTRVSETVPPASSVYVPVLSEFAITGSSLELATVTVAAIDTVTESSPAPVVPPLSFRVVIVTTRLLATDGESSVFL